MFSKHHANQPQMLSLEATITRADGTVEHLGTIAYYHRSPVKRLMWRLRRALKGVLGHVRR